jgi:hypothetical protein
MSAPEAAEHERFFAATALRPACQKQRELAEPSTLQALVPLLAQQLAAAAAAGCRHTCNQLAAALATLAVRAPSWPEQQCLPQLLALVQQALQAHASAGSGSACGSKQQQQQQEQQEQEQRLALLRLLAALPEAAASRDISMHPQRREALKQALAAAPEPLAAVQQALAPGSSLAVQAAALQLLQAWCGLGVPPAGAEGSVGLCQLLHQAALQPQLGSAASECVAALYGCCLADSGGGSSGSRGSSSAGDGGSGSAPDQQRQRQRQLLGLLLGLLPGFATQLQHALSQAQCQAQADIFFSAITILSAAAKAADSQQAWEAGQQAAACPAIHLAAEVTLAALQHLQFDVSLAALQQWDEQLERWQAEGTASSSGAGSGACSLQQRKVLLGRLCGALLQRMALPASLPTAAVTADARDLPPAVQQVGQVNFGADACCSCSGCYWRLYAACGCRHSSCAVVFIADSGCTGCAPHPAPAGAAGGGRHLQGCC